MGELASHEATTAALRWDFVTNPPTQLLAELGMARAWLHWGQFAEARVAANRLLRHLDAKLPPGAPSSARPFRFAEIHADALAVYAITARMLGRTDAERALEQCKAVYGQLLVDGHGLRPPSLACYGMVLALSAPPADSVEPLVRAAEAGEDISADLVLDVAHRLLEGENFAEAARLLRATHERYPGNAILAAELAHATQSAGDPAAAADAHVAAGALCAEARDFRASLDHFAKAGQLAPAHPLAALGTCQALLAVGHIEAALSAVDEVRGAQPHLAGAHAVTALGLALSGKWADALNTVDEALQRFRDDPWLLDTRIRILLGTGDEEAALVAVDHALAVDSTDREWRSMRAEILLSRRQDVEAALQTLRELAASTPDSVAPTVRLARALDATGRADEALKVTERALFERPREHTLLTLQVQLLTALGRYGEAASSAQEAIARGVRRDAVALAWAESLLALGQHAEAIPVADEAVAAEAASTRARRVHGLALYRAGRHDEAVADLEAVVHAEDDSEAKLALGACLARIGSREASSGDTTRARELLIRAVSVDPVNVLARRWLAELLRRSGDYVSALKHADLGLEVEPADAWLVGTRGQILEALEDFERAEADLRRAVDLDPDMAWAQAELGELLRIKKRHREALTHLGRAITKNPEDPWPWASRAAAEYALDRYDDALRSVDRALELDGDYGWAHAVKATVLTDVDHLVGAKQHVERGLELEPKLGWAWSLKGWLLLLDAVDRDIARPEAAEQALGAYLQAFTLEPYDIHTLTGLGDVRLLLGQVDDATALFHQAVTRINAHGAADAGAQASLGWCNLRLREHENAVDALVRAIALDSAHVSAAFNLALALLCSGRTEVAWEEYAQAIARVRAVRHPGRRRSLLRVARRDLNVLALDQLQHRADDVEKVHQLLDESGGDDGRLRARSIQVR